MRTSHISKRLLVGESPRVPPAILDRVEDQLEGDTDGAVSEQDEVDFNMTVTSSGDESFENNEYQQRHKMPVLRSLQ